MPRSHCRVCGAPLQITIAARVAECEYCGTSNQLQREGLKRQIDDSDEISPEQFEKLHNRAHEFLEGQQFNEAFSIINKLVEYLPYNPALRSEHAYFFLFEQLHSLIGEAGVATVSWKAECDHSGNGFYSDYTSPDFESIFTFYNTAIEDVIELAGNDQEAQALITSHRVTALEGAKDMIQAAIQNFISKYGHKVEKGSRLVERDGKTYSESYTNYTKNLDAEEVATKMASAIIFFYCLTYQEMLEAGDLRPEEIDYKSIYSFLLYYTRHARLSYSGLFANDGFEFGHIFVDVVPSCIDEFYDYQLMVDVNATHPLGSAIKYEKLCDYAQKLRDFAAPYVQDGLLQASEVEACVQGMDEIRREACALSNTTIICILCSIMVIIIPVAIPIVGLGMVLGLLVAVCVMAVQGFLMSGQADATLLKVTRNSERVLRAEAVRQKRLRLSGGI